jgi:3',5'-cyclic AMP phosphodiesterase CpdA
MHFGAELANRRSEAIPFQGPHDVGKCMVLPAALISACELMETSLEGTELPVVVSGDLTVRGASTELAVSNGYLRSRIEIARLPSKWGMLGLGRRSALLATIPGNHDHWGGSLVPLPHNPALYPSSFRPTPWKKVFAAKDRSITLELFGVDSNSGLAEGEANPISRTVKGLGAKGNISANQFERLRNLLKKTDATKSRRLVRAIVCHHSISYKSGIFSLKELDSESRDRLLRLCADYNISAILTGHTHDSGHFKLETMDGKGKLKQVYELRSANTVGFGSRPGINKQDSVGFLTHRISEYENKLHWETWRWDWVWSSSPAGTGGYEPRAVKPCFSFFC